MKFTVDRSKWYRGMGGDGSALLRLDGSRCCVGFYFAAHGIADAQLIGRPYGPSSKDLHAFCSFQEEHLWLRENRDCADGGVYRINDDATISDSEREKLLADAFAQNGHVVEFVDGAT